MEKSENLQRKEVDPIDIARGLKKLVEEYCPGNSKTKIIEEILPTKLGIAEQTIWCYLALLDIVPELQEAVSEGKLAIKSGANLKQLPEEEQKKFAEE